MPGEFDLIQRYFTRSSARSDVLLAVGDDCALLQPAADQVLAVSTDTLIAGVHFPHHTAPYDIGWKSLAVNLSDLAAMGATPAWVSLALSLPSIDGFWLEQFSAGLFALADQHELALVGGDTTRGPLSITLTVQGFVPAGQALRRDGASPGELIAVTGTLGDAARALPHVLQQRLIDEPATAERLSTRLNRPTPQISLGIALRGIASSAIDISDGLAQDLTHVLQRSGVGARVQLAQLPLSAELMQQSQDHEEALRFALAGGDDYELCITLPPAHWPQAQAAAQAVGVALTVIGETTAEGSGLQLRLHDQPFTLRQQGFDHFGEQA